MQLDQFRNALVDCGLSIIPYEGYRYTWDRGRDGNANIEEHIDWGFANNDFSEAFPDVLIRHLPRKNSYYLPLLAALGADDRQQLCERKRKP